MVLKFNKGQKDNKWLACVNEDVHVSVTDALEAIRQSFGMVGAYTVLIHHACYVTSVIGCDYKDCYDKLEEYEDEKGDPDVKRIYFEYSAGGCCIELYVSKQGIPDLSSNFTVVVSGACNIINKVTPTSNITLESAVKFLYDGVDNSDPLVLTFSISIYGIPSIEFGADEAENIFQYINSTIPLYFEHACINRRTHIVTIDTSCKINRYTYTAIHNLICNYNIIDYGSYVEFVSEYCARNIRDIVAQCASTDMVTALIYNDMTVFNEHVNYGLRNDEDNSSIYKVRCVVDSSSQLITVYIESHNLQQEEINSVPLITKTKSWCAFPSYDTRAITSGECVYLSDALNDIACAMARLGLRDINTRFISNIKHINSFTAVVSVDELRDLLLSVGSCQDYVTDFKLEFTGREYRLYVKIYAKVYKTMKYNIHRIDEHDIFKLTPNFGSMTVLSASLYLFEVSRQYGFENIKYLDMDANGNINGVCNVYELTNKSLYSYISQVVFKKSNDTTLVVCCYK